jgi:hypothetical protein
LGFAQTGTEESGCDSPPEEGITWRPLSESEPGLARIIEIDLAKLFF